MRFSAGNKLVSERVLAGMMKAGLNQLPCPTVTLADPERLASSAFARLSHRPWATYLFLDFVSLCETRSVGT